ncbi:hypothetical protein [Gracilibacillus sp. YIM 98692]|uniref:hypothetical protein n=1 Tax=Gracilibacillus sp. YIM 98692 TaxID=2663532 RepID=UPI0013D4501E|nr:hypothetical protein [Gracilibacillus sp. YIM 98692]
MWGVSIFAISLIVLVAILLVLALLYYLFFSLEFIQPTSVQQQLFGIHITIFGGLIYLKSGAVPAFVIMLVGFGIGVVASFKGRS